MDLAIQHRINLDFWIGRLRKTQRLPNRNGAFASHLTIVPKEKLLYFRKVTQQKKLVEYTVLLGVYTALLNRYFPFFNGIVLGQLREEGLFPVPLPILLEKNDQNSLKEWLNTSKASIQEAFTYKEIEEEDLLQHLQSSTLHDFTYFSLSGKKSESPFHLRYRTLDNGDLELELSFSKMISTAAVGKHFLDNVGNYLINLASLLDTPLNEINWVGSKEKEQLLVKFNETKRQIPHKSIVDLFEAQVERSQEDIAVVSAEKKYSYRALNEEANRWANQLISDFGIRKGHIVGVMLPKSEKTLIAILAILKTGASFLPIDTNYPADRIQYIIEDSGMKLLVCEDNSLLANDLSPRVSPSQIRGNNKDNPNCNIDPSDLAYVIYTSGSTGKPKGVMIAHRSNVNMSLDQIRILDITSDDKIIWFASVAFDASVSEIMMALYAGACLNIPADEMVKDKNLLCAFLRETATTVATFPPSYLDLLKDEELLGLRCLITAGEAAHAERAMKLASKVRYFNAYGPTECAVCVSMFEVEKNGKNFSTIPIGGPIANLSVYLLDANLNLVPIGIEGSIFVAGVGLARGYIGKQELTNEKFVDNPFEEGTKMYDTGDLGKWLPDGNIEFLGRNDHQVKIRGHRVELDEITNNLLKFDEIKQATVIPKLFNAQDVLVAYIVGKSSIDKAKLRQQLSAFLPGYMMPSFFITLKELPLTTHGKIDKKALPELSQNDLARKEYRPPSNEIQVQMVEIWQEALGIDKIGITDNFFECGGHSLVVGQVINKMLQRIGQTVSFKDFFANPTIALLSKKMEAAQFTPIQTVAESAAYALPSSQKRLWVLSQIEGGSIAYNMVSTVKIKGAIDIELFEKAFLQLIQRYEILRTYFKVKEENVLQYILPAHEVDFKIAYVDFSEQAAPKEEIDAYLQAKNKEPFNLEAAPLVKASLVKMEEDVFVFFLSIHHIIGDGWSIEIMVDEVIKSFNGLVAKKQAEPSPLRLQYKDCAAWLNEQIGQPKFLRDEQYWLKQFDGGIPVLNLPSFKARPPIFSYKGNTVRYQYASTFLEKLKTFSQEQDVTLFMLLMTGVNALFYRYTGQEDIIIGTPIAGRNHPDLENQIGLFLNTLAIRTRIEKDQAFINLLQHEKEVLLNAYEHQAYPFDELVDNLKLKRDSSRSALFDVFVVLQNQHQLKNIGAKSDLDGLTLSPYDFPSDTTQFDVSFTFVETEGLELSIEYNSDIYDEALINRMFVHFEQLLSQLIDRPSASVTSVDYLRLPEKNVLLEDFNRPILDPVYGVTMVDLFEQQVEKYPDRTAVVFEGKQLTYKQLNESANQLAYFLREKHAIQPEDLIGIKLERSDLAIVAILGILKAGAAYVPIDINYPKERVEYIEKDCNCKTLVDEKMLRKYILAAKAFPKSNPIKNIQSNNLAYVIYTSGTTGKPKGVMVEHSSGVSVCRSWVKHYGLDKFTVNLLQLASISFDVFVGDICRSLLIGGKMIICSNEVKLNPPSLYKLIKDNEVSILDSTPGFLLPLVEYIQVENKDFAALKVLIFGADVFLNHDYIKLKNEIGERVRIVNGYGVTEATIDSTYYKDYHPSLQGATPIGRPLSNTKITILDRQGNLVPIGVPGELCIGGRGLARGYLNRPELTAEKFVPNSLRKGELMYQTGDMGRWLEDGNIEFMGRLDHQVKIRGYRVELGEIEHAILQYADTLSHVVLLAKKIGQEKALVVYYVASSDIDKLALKDYLKTRLPEYMVPNFYLKLDEIPLTTNGKVNRSALPDLSESDFIRKKYIAPTTDTEKSLAGIWQEVLQVNKVGVTDNFFDLGGHSLTITKLLFLINKKLDTKVSYTDLFTNANIKEQAKLVESSRKTAYADISAIPTQEDYVLSSSQRRLWVLSQFEEGKIAYNMPAAFRLKGELELDVLEKAFFLLIQRHESLRTNFRTNDHGEIRQFILAEDKSQFQLQYEEQIGQAKEKVDALIKEVLEHRFDLENDSLLRAKLIKTAEGQFLFCFVMHHIISDGWSTEIMTEELFGFYDLLLNDKKNTSAPLTLQYKDYAAWQQEQLKDGNLAADGKYWLSQFEAPLPVLELPTVNPRPAIKTYNGDFVRKTFDHQVLADFMAINREQGTTLFMGMLALVNIILHKYSRQSDIIIGSAIAGREHIDLQDQIGFYVNTLALRTQFTGSESFLTLLHKVKEVALQAFEHQAYPFDELVENLAINRDLSRNPLFDVMITFQDTDNASADAKKLGKLSMENYLVEAARISKFDLDFIFEQTEKGLELVLTYNTDIYNKDFAQQISDHLGILLQNIIPKPTQPIYSLEYLKKEEIKQLSQEFNLTTVDYPVEKTFLDFFKEQVELSAQKIAVKDASISYSYEELDQLSDQISNFLLEKNDLEERPPIAVLLDRSAMMVATLIGIMKTGSPYIPIDPDFPKDRINYIVAHSGANLIICEDSSGMEKQEGIKTISLKEISGIIDSSSRPFLKHISSKDSAYIIYTSGSTGKPKGVEIGHQSLLNFLLSMTQKPGLGKDDTLFAVTTYSFDISILEFFAPLVAGATLYVASKYDLADPNIIIEKIAEIQPTIIQATPSFYQMLFHADWKGNKQLKVLCGGDSLSEALAQKILLHTKELWNMYGPTETTIWSSIKQIERPADASNIGQAINNTSFYLLDDFLKLMPIGSIGAIYIGGHGLAKGYYKNEELTKDRFIKNPFGSGKIYETGDVGRWNALGEIEFLGRNDNQVKIRGYRIEVGEIERALLNIPTISQAIVVVKTDDSDNKQLVACLTSEQEIDAIKLKKQLQNSLPDYMLPSFYYQLKQLPLTPNGKVDRKRLVELKGQASISSVPFVAPRNEIEENLSEIWQTVLGQENISMKDHFFEKGGNSLSATRLVGLIFKKYEVKISFNDLFQNMVLEDQAVLIQKILLANVEVDTGLEYENFSI